MKLLTLSVLFVHLPTDQAGCPADYRLVGCFDDSRDRRIMPWAYVMSQQEPMSAMQCCLICDDGINTHFGTQNSNECWCSSEPELSEFGPELNPGDCNMLCDGTTIGETCGGIHKMSVYEITSYKGCDSEEIDKLSQHASSDDQQIMGQLWDYQEKFDTTSFFMPTHSGASSLTNTRLPGSCDVEDDHKKLLTQIDVWDGAEKGAPRIFCGIYTHEKNHATKVKAVKETWASHCDGFVAFSDVADLELHTFKIKHEGPEEYSNMWQKARAIWKYINFHYKDDFDWFVLGGDDLFLIMENLRKYLLSDEIKRAAGGLENGGPNPMYLGRRFRFIGENRIYNNGGPSYVLNQASVGLLASHLDDDACQPHAAKHWEDILVAWCLKKNGVEAFDTRDALGRERFHPFTPAAHFGYRMPEKLEDRLVSGCVVGAWYIIQGIDLKFGRECCSQDSLSFHYVGEQLSRRLHDLIYACPKYQADAAVAARV